MWTMSSKRVPRLNTGVKSISHSPFEKIKRPNQSINKINVIYDGNKIKQKEATNNKQINNYPFQFDVNLYFGNNKSSFTPIHQTDNYYYFHHNDTSHNSQICLLFKSSLEKSGYKLTPGQTAQYKDVYKKYNSISSFYDDINCYCFPMRESPINNNNNIINNIYPTFTKVTNVQILSDNEQIKNTKNSNNDKNNYNNINYLKNNSSDLENKKENINEDNFTKKDSNTKSKEDKKNINDICAFTNDNETNGSKKQKIIFECSESNGPGSPLTSKKMLKKKRLRKNNEQLELLSKFYLENKNWSKKQIKEISENIGLKENKIYKWLWDQKNKEYKVTKFVVNKDKNKFE